MSERLETVRQLADRVGLTARPIPRFAMRAREAADSLGVSLGQFLAWVKAGKMPRPIKFGRNLVLYDVEDVRRAWQAMVDSVTFEERNSFDE